MPSLIRAGFAFAALASLPATAYPQNATPPLADASREISLEAAIAQALSQNSELQIAEARSSIASSGARSAAAPLWPQITLEAGYLRSVDPVVSFGTKLRQGRFAQQDFDLDALNNPDPVNDWTAGLVARWALLDPTRWAGRASARHQAKAASWSAARTREATILLTRTLYYRALAAEAAFGAAEAAEEAAQATYDSFRRRQERGLLTEADLLQAEAELAAARAELSQAERLHVDALDQLGRHLGWGPDTLPQPTDTLTAPTAVGELDFDPDARADLRALAATAAAAGAAKRGARLAFLPAVDAFAQFSTHSAEAFSFDEDDWTLGVMLRWPLFSGFARFAESQRASHEERVARIQHAQALRDARAEVEQARRAVAAARRQVEATRAAADAAESGRRLMRRRFDEGLATAADRLQAEARASAMRQLSISALANYHMAVARLDFVRSHSNAESE